MADPLKTHTVYKTFNTTRRREFVRITEDVQQAVDESGVSEGMVLVSAMHITAGVWVNDQVSKEAIPIRPWRAPVCQRRRKG